MEQVIIYQNTHWRNKKYQGLFERSCLKRIKNKLEVQAIQVLAGVRRCGKSSIFKLLINDLMEKVNPKKILFLNLDDPVFHTITENASNLYDIITLAEKITNEKIEYLFLDEIQNVYLWEKFVKSIFDSQMFKKIFITGSNSSMLHGDLATLLTGRYLIDNIFPLSFVEILKIKKLSSTLDVVENKSRVLQIVDNMLEYGSFPEVFKSKDKTNKIEMTKTYYDSIISKDCILRNNVRDKKTFFDLAGFLTSAFSSTYTYNSLSKAIETNENTVKSFLGYLKDSYILHTITNFSYSQKISKRPKQKIYWTDNGIINAVAFRFSENKGRLFENLVFNELTKLGINPIHFYNEQNECDFIFEDQYGNRTAIQAVFEITNENLARETKGLDKVKELYDVKKGIILTYNQSIDLSGYEVVPFWKYVIT